MHAYLPALALLALAVVLAGVPARAGAPHPRPIVGPMARAAVGIAGR